MQQKGSQATRRIVRVSMVTVLAASFIGGGNARAAPARTADQAAASSDPSAMPNARERARSLFEQGQLHYSLGEYGEAIARFREAYELSAAPGLLFNLAQAHRLKGDCAPAIEIYRHFKRLAPDSPHVAEADTQIAALSATCPPAPTPAITATAQPTPAASGLHAYDLTSTPSKDDASPSGPRPSTRRRVAQGLLIGGAVLGVGTGVLYWWNGARYDRWNTEDGRLANGPPPGTAPQTWIARQNSNDALLRSIHHVDTAVIAFGAVAAACVLGSATFGIWSDRAQVAVAPGEIRIAYRLPWP